MPSFDTGNAQWDQGLSSLGNALFPDPSKVAQGYYYGSEARKAQIEGYRLIDQQNYKNRLMQGVYSGQGGYSTPAPASPTWSQPPISGMAPIINAPSNIPMSSVVTGTGPTGGAVVQPTMTPAQVVDRAATAAENSPNAFKGTPAANSSPTPNAGTPAAPTTTATNGSVPNTDGASAVIHPGSVQPPGGGQKYAPPANPDGTPAAPIMNLSTYVATAVAAGMDAAQAQTMGAAALATAFQQGRIDEHTYHQLLGGAGVPQFGVADTQASSAKTVAGIQAGAELEKQRMVTGEQRREFEQAPTLIQGPNGQPISVPRSQAQAGASPIFVPEIANTTQTQGGAYGTYVDPNNPTNQIYTTAADARSKGLVPKATSPEQQIAALQQQYELEKDPVKKAALYQQLQTLAATPKPVTAEEANAQRQVNYQNDQQIYAQPQTGMANLGVKDPVAFRPDATELINRRTFELQRDNPRRYLSDPAAAHADAVTQLIREGALQSPSEINNLRGPARGKVTSAGFAGDTRIGTVAAPGSQTATDHMMVGVTDKGRAMLQGGGGAAPGPAAPAAPGPAAAPATAGGPGPAPGTGSPGPGPAPASAAPAVASSPQQLYGSGSGNAPAPGPAVSANPLSRLFGPGGTLNPPPTSATPMTPSQMYGSQPAAAPVSPQVSGGAPPGAIGPAPPNTREGQTLVNSNGQVIGVNRGGWAYPIGR